MFSIQQRDSVGPSRRVGVARVLTIIFHNLVLETCASVDRTKVNNNQQSSPATQNGGLDSIGSNTSTQVLNFRDLIRRAAARNNIDNSTTLHLVVRLAWKEAEAEGLVARCILFVRLLCLLFVCTWFFASRGHERDIFIETSSSVYPSLCVAECQDMNMPERALNHQDSTKELLRNWSAVKT